MKKAHTGKLPPHPLPKSPSWVVERNALLQWGDRKTRTILAIYQARRSARRTEFFIHPEIARVNCLSPADLNWALGKLEGLMIETVQSKSGSYRRIRLLSEFEETAGDFAGDKGQTRQNGYPTSPGEERVRIDTAQVLARLARKPMEPTDL